MTSHRYPGSSATDEIWLVSNLPPPVHGVAVFNASLLDELERREVPVRVFRVGSDRADRIGQFSISKSVREGFLLVSFLSAAFRRRLRGGGRTILYFTPSQGGPAVFRDAVVAMIGSACLDRVIGHIHGCGWLDRVREGGLVARAMKRALSSCHHVICLGDGFTHAMRAATGIDCVAVDNGTRSVRDGNRRVLPSHGMPLQILFLGNFIRSKGLWAAAEATEILLHRGLSVRLKCAGSWRSETERFEFEERFGDGMSRGAIQFLGRVDGKDKEEALLEAHVLVLPTRYPHEGQPLVLIEAMSAGAVPVTTDQGGIPDLMSFAGSERLVSASHDTGLGVARTIEALVREPEEYEALSARCLERFRSHLTMDRCVTEILAVIRGDADPGMEAWESKRAAV